MIGNRFDLDELLREADSICVTGHVNPDGDCIGSCLGLWNYISENFPEKTARVYLGEFEDSLQILQGADQIRHMPEPVSYDLCIVVDCSGLERVGDNAVLFEKARKTACIDHHVTGAALADVNWIVPEASSTCELVCRLMEPEKIGKGAAEALYLGMAHDTGVFQYSCTSSLTMQLAGMLMDKGIRYSRLIEDTYYSKSFVQKKLLGRALEQAELDLDGQLLVSWLDLETVQKLGASRKDLGGIVSELRTTRGIEAAMFIYETTSGEWKVSLRTSEKVDAAKISQSFGGGGHERAAGFSMNGELARIREMTTEKIRCQLAGE